MKLNLTKELRPVFLGFLIIGAVSGCNQSKSPNNTAQRALMPDYFKTHFQDESQFIVESIASDLAEQVFYAKHQQLPDPKFFSVSATEKSDPQSTTHNHPPQSTILINDPQSAVPSYDLTIVLGPKQQVETQLTINGPIWSPEIYDGVVLALAKEVGLKTDAAGQYENTDLLKKLADGTAATVEKENQKLSQSLEDDFSDPALHEQAAVLLGAFALRDHSSAFYDIRLPLCRMTSHLVMARYLGGNSYGINGQVAEAMLLTLMNNETTALEKLSYIKTNNDALTSWVRALRVRNTEDYRPLDKLDGLSQVESVEWFHALYVCADTDIAWSKLNDSQKRISDFVRVANEGGYSVGLGHQLSALSLPLELEEIGTVYELSHGQQLKRTEITNALNQIPERCFSTNAENHLQVRIIGWGQWALFLQRHLCRAIEMDYSFLEWKWGVPEYAKAFSAKVDKAFGGLRLYPFVQRLICADADTYHKSVDNALKVAVETPQIIPDQCWNSLCYYKPSFSSLYTADSMSGWFRWYKRDILPGTAYDLKLRLVAPIISIYPKAFWDGLHELAPYDWSLNYYLLKTRYNDNPTYEQAVAIFQPVLPYANYAMEKVAATVKDQPDKYEPLVAKAAELNPSDYFMLADYFKDRNVDDKAARYYEKGIQLDPDAVDVAYHANWLVHYYLKKNQTENARRLANFAGEVYSYNGLETQAEFYEAIKNYDEAFQCYSNIKERYNDPGPVMAFCTRYKSATGDARFDNALKQQLNGLFPKGIEKSKLADFQSMPTDGVLVEGENNLTQAARLKEGDVIVSVNGIRVHNFAQYNYGRETGSAELDLIVWQGNGYHEIKASPPNHRFGVNFGDYPQK